MSTVAITGAWSYSGRRVAARLLEAGDTVVSLTNRAMPEPDPHGGRVRAAPYDFSSGVLERALEGVDVLACAYWSRHDRAPLGHRGPWLSHDQAVSRPARIIDAARAAGVGRLVWTSIANPGLDPDLPYYAAASRVMGETILTTDELVGLSRNRLDSLEEPPGRIGLLAWLEEHSSEVGWRFAREPRRQPGELRI